MRLHLILTCWGFLPQNLHHKTYQFAHFLVSLEYHNLTQWQKKHGDSIVSLIPRHFSMLQKLQEGSAHNPAWTYTLNQEPVHSSWGVYVTHLNPQKHRNNHWLDVRGPPPCYSGVWWLFSVNHLPSFIPHCSLSSLCPSSVIPRGQHHSGSLTRRSPAGDHWQGESEVRVVLPSLLSFSIPPPE